jgi:transcriptional regulator with XRE-family HTH domain
VDTAPELVTGFAGRIQRLRADHGLSQERLAELLGVSRMSVIRWEQGKVRPSALAWRRLELAEQAPLTATQATPFVGREAEQRLLDGTLSRHPGQCVRQGG